MNAVLIFCVLQVWNTQIPKLEFHTSERDDLKVVQEIVDAYEINALEIGRHSSRMIIDTGNDIEIKHALQQHTDDGAGVEKWIIVSQILPTSSQPLNDENGMRPVQERQIKTILKKDHALFYTGYEAIRLDAKKEVRDHLISEKALFPFACPLLPDLIDKGFLNIWTKHLDTARITQISISDEIVVCQYFFTGQFDLTRTIVFQKKLPVYMHENFGKVYDSRIAVRTTETKWQHQSGHDVPVKIVWSSKGFGIDEEMEARLSWKFGMEVSDEEFGIESLSGLPFGEP